MPIGLSARGGIAHPDTGSPVAVRDVWHQGRFVVVMRPTSDQVQRALGAIGTIADLLNEQALRGHRVLQFAAVFNRNVDSEISTAPSLLKMKVVRKGAGFSQPWSRLSTCTGLPREPLVLTS